MSRQPIPLGEEELNLVAAELWEALRRFPALNSPHEGYAVILEELDELWHEIKANDGRGPKARAEACQVAAMAVRYMIDLTRNGAA
jgi:hypothetical protein